MKSMIKGVLGAFGLAPAGHSERLARQLHDATAKVQALEERLGKSKADVETWKRRSEDAVNGSAELKKIAARADAAVEKAQTGAQRAEAHAEEWRGRAKALTTQLAELRARLEDSKRGTTSAREQLMAMEVKLDLIEAAIQVLDTRTREAALPASSDTLRT